MASKMLSRAPRLYNNSVNKPRLALISGAASSMGIGRATALAFARNGANVIVTDISSNEKAGRALVEQINKERNGTDAEALWVELDVSKEEQWNSAVKKAEEHFRAPLDVAFLNAGILVEPGWEVKMEDHPTDSYHKTIAVNQTGVYYGLKASVRSMAKRDPGLKEAASIILTASVAGTSGTLGPFVYSATKAAVISMTKWAAVDLGSRNIRVNCIQPGAINTNIMEFLGDGPEGQAMRKKLAAVEPLAQRMAEPTEMAQVAVFLASDESSFVTGAQIAADGGMLAVNGLRSGLLGVSKPEYA